MPTVLILPVKYLHIVSFNIPHPPNYGGIIDVYYKLLSLSDAGIKIILHCFSYGRQPSKELENICFKVHYYSRHSGLKYYFQNVPYIVSTRNANTMPDLILKDSFPVLFEGLHTTGILERCKQANKKVLVRAHNVEHNYYRYLANSESNLFRKLFFRSESRKLRDYEQVLHHADKIICISKHETKHFEEVYGKALFIPAFHRNRIVKVKEGSGSYILYHGNLSVAENIDAVKYITSKIINETNHRFIIAGKDPSNKLIKWLEKYSRIEIISNPDEDNMNQLIRDAQINILFTFQPTGLKLKLLNALFTGRHCVVNPLMVEGSDLEDACHVVSNPDQAIRMINHLMTAPLSEDDIERRRKTISRYSNRENAQKIIRLLG